MLAFRSPLRSVAALAAGVFGLLAPCNRSEGQAEPVRHILVAAPLDSGPQDNPLARPQVVFQQVVQVAGAPWLRLALDSATLGDKSFVRITSFADGEMQMLDATALGQWRNTSAYFNGGAVLVELVAGPRTTRNHITMTRVLAGSEPVTGIIDRRVCEAADNRGHAVNKKVGRLLALQLPFPNCPGNLPCTTTGAGLCTGELIDVAPDDNADDRLLVSAGHCFGPTGAPAQDDTNAPCVVIQFGPVPDTDTVTCGYRHPPVAKQFVVNSGRVRYNNPSSCGNDWAVFTVCKNPTTNKTAYEEQVEAFTLAPAAPAAGAQITKFGYGADGPASTRFCGCVAGDSASAKNGTLQSSPGMVMGAVGADFGVRHNCHTCGGDSGCALVDDQGRLVAIHTEGACTVNPAPPRNCGTAVTNTNLQAAINLIKTQVRPVNDDCANAAVVLLGDTPYVTKNATTDGPTDYRFNFDGDRQVRNDVWFRFNSPVDFPLAFRVSVCNSDFDTRLAIYELGCPSGPDTALLVADDSPGCGIHSELTFTAEPFASYLIRVGAYGDRTGMGTLTIGLTNAPGNNACGAQLRQANIGENFFDNTTATTDGPAEAACDGMQITQDVWWRFNSCQNGRVRIETCGATVFDTCLAAYVFNEMAAGCPRGALIAADDNACGRQSRIEIDVEAGRSYVIRVGGARGAHGAGVLTIQPIVPSNDNCADATTIFEGRVTFDNRGATTDGPVPVGCAPRCEKDVWFYYIYTGAAAARIAIETCDAFTDFDTVLVVYGGAQCPPASMQVACNDDACGKASRVVIDAMPGDDFVIRVGSFLTTSTGCGALKITASAGNAPTNNTSCDFTVLYDGRTPYSTTNATTDGINPVGCLAAMPNRDIENDIWYRYATTTAGNIVVDGCDATFDARMAAYSSTYPGGMLRCPPREAERVACGDDDCGDDGFEPLMNVPVAVDADGSTLTDFYWVRVGGFRPAGGPTEEGAGTLNVRLLLNDNCDAARLNFFRPGVLAGDGVNTFNNKGARPFGPNPADGPALGAGCDPMTMLRGDLWFYYTATTSGDASFAVTGPFMNFVAIYDAPLICVPAVEATLPVCPGGAPLECDHANADAGGGNKRSTVTRALIAGNHYWVRLGGFGEGQFGEGTLNITPTAPAGPENNDCVNARVAELGDNVFTTVNATTDGLALPVGCAPDNQIHQDVWFSFTPSMPGNLVVETCAGPAAFDTRLAVYSPPIIRRCPPRAGDPAPAAIVEPCAGLTLLANGCNDNSPDAACSPRSSLNVEVETGIRYLIRVGGVNNMTGAGVLTLRFIMNDVCVRAKQINTAGGAYPFASTSVAFNNRGANTDGAAAAACTFFAEAQIGQDLWYFFSVPQKGRLAIDTIGSTFDTKLAIYDGVVLPPRCPPGAPLACNDDIGGGNVQSSISRDVMGGDIILIRVGGFRANQGAGVLNLRFTDNDTCDRARGVTEGLWGFDTRGAAQDGMASCGLSNTTPDVWFRYTAGCDGDVIADTCNSNYDSVLSIYNDDCAMLMEQACNDDDLAVHCVGLRQSYLTAPVTMGGRYLIRVSGFNGQTGFGQLSLQCEAKGACCVGATCQDLRRSECTGPNKFFNGPDTTCNPPGDNLTPCCRADFNHNGMVSVQDLFDFLMAYFANDISADADGNTMVQLQDIFSFLAAYFAGCN